MRYKASVLLSKDTMLNIDREQTETVWLIVGGWWIECDDEHGLRIWPEEAVHRDTPVLSVPVRGK